MAWVTRSRRGTARMYAAPEELGEVGDVEDPREISPSVVAGLPTGREASAPPCPRPHLHLRPEAEGRASSRLASGPWAVSGSVRAEPRRASQTQGASGSPSHVWLVERSGAPAHLAVLRTRRVGRIDLWVVLAGSGSASDRHKRSRAAITEISLLSLPFGQVVEPSESM